MTRQDAVNHVLYWNGDAGIAAANHPAGYRIEWDAAKPDVKTWYGGFQRVLNVTCDGAPVSIDRTPTDGWTY